MKEILNKVIQNAKNDDIFNGDLKILVIDIEKLTKTESENKKSVSKHLPLTYYYL